jgi:Tol biopolymer transport system component
MSVNGTVSYDDAAKTVTFTPQIPLLNQVQYKTTLTTDLKASDTATVTAAATLASNYTWQFTTVSRPLLYVSTRAFDGSDAYEPSSMDNIWSLNPSDGSSNHLTTLVNSNAEFPTWSPDGTKIFFASNRGLTDTAIPGINIWVMNADGSDLKPVEKPSVALVFAWSGYQKLSPDGSKISFFSNRPLSGVGPLNPVYNIWVMNTDGSSLKTLTPPYGTIDIVSGGLEWSPDGSKIVYASNGAISGADEVISNGCYNVWVVGLDGSLPKPLTTINIAHAHSVFPQWSPDGSMIAYISWRPLGADPVANPVPNIWVMKNDGSEAKPKTSNKTQYIDNRNPLWSPDGSNILYISNADLTGEIEDKWNIWVVGAADGAIPKALTGNTVRNYWTFNNQWSQDGSKIFFVSSQPFDGSTSPLHANNIWMMNADGSGATALTKLTTGAYMESISLEDWWW